MVLPHLGHIKAGASVDWGAGGGQSLLLLLFDGLDVQGHEEASVHKQTRPVT